MKNNSTLIKNLLSDFRINSYYQNISLMLIGSLILAISSKVQVPFWPVPMTMQTFVVFLIGMTFGSKLAFLAIYGFSWAISSLAWSFAQVFLGFLLASLAVTLSLSGPFWSHFGTCRLHFVTF